MTGAAEVLSRRRAGVLLHPTSLPGMQECGSLGADAYRFVDFLVAAGVSLWQVLPVGPTHADGSPYGTLSVHAGNPLLIDRQWLSERGWLPAGATATGARLREAAYTGFSGQASADERDEFEAYAAIQQHWLDDYALFCVIREQYEEQPWSAWPELLRRRESKALAVFSERHRHALAQVRFEQFVFFQQWQALKRYANERGLLLFGDLPIFVAHDSADVWAGQDFFRLDEHGQPVVVAGVPPDYFSATGQRWGNPLYDWARMAEDGYAWWQQRLATQLALFDIVRIDHFRGFESFWEIDAREETALGGHWVKAPGKALFDALRARFGQLPLVAEDLGLITPEVQALREELGLPGMRILQFAFDTDAANPYLPHNHHVDSVVYTGTHDNDTTVGWYHGLGDNVRRYVDEYLGQPSEPMPWALIRTAMASVANLAVIPLQDLLALGGEHRMNTPGTQTGNWNWRFEWSQLGEDVAPRVYHLVSLYGRR